MNIIKDLEKQPINIEKPNAVSYPVTWVDGRVVFKLEKKYSDFYYGLCSFSGGVFAVTPLDYERPVIGITSIMISPTEKYCERAYSCLNFTCLLNQFNKGIYLDEFKDCGSFSLSLPNNIGTKPLWFSVDKWRNFWFKFIIPIEGGRLNYKEK